VLTGLAFAVGGELGFSRSVTPGLSDYYARLFGQDARGRLRGWKDFVRSTASRAAQAPGSGGEVGLLDPANGFFNRLPSITDLVHWGVEDYWATPSEFLASNGGDCEDYAIAKYFTLKELGVPLSRLRMVYAQTWRADGAHMVLAYYPSLGAEPLILDNLEGSIRPASERPDLIPVYAFNDDDLTFSQKGGLAVRFDAQSIRKWRGVLDKLARELTY